MAHRIPIESTGTVFDSLAFYVKPTAPPLGEVEMWNKAEKIYNDYLYSLKEHEGALSRSEMALQADQAIHLIVNQSQSRDFKGYWSEKMAHAAIELFMAHERYAGPAAASLSKQELDTSVHTMEKYFLKLMAAIGVCSDDEKLTTLMFRREDAIPFVDFHHKMYSVHAQNELEEDRKRFDEKKNVELAMHAAQLVRDQIDGKYGDKNEEKRIVTKRRSRLVHLAIEIKKEKDLYDNVDAGNPYDLDIDTRPIEDAWRNNHMTQMMSYVDEMTRVMEFEDPDE